MREASTSLRIAAGTLFKEESEYNGHFWENEYVPTLDNEATAARYRRWCGMEGGKFQVD
jgi:hypothetical protein